MKRNKKVVRLTESKLKNILKQSINSILKEHLDNVDQGEYALEIVKKLEEVSDLMHDYMMSLSYGNEFKEASELIKRAISLIKKHKNNILWDLDIEDYEDDDTFGQLK